MLPQMPSWVTSTGGETFEDVMFLSGAALSYLHLVVTHPTVPHALLLDRLALRAAVSCSAQFGRVQMAGDLRDAVHLLRPGDLPGPAGEMYLAWRRAVERPVSVRDLERALSGPDAEQIATWLDAGAGGPIARAASVFEAVLSDMPHGDHAACVLADAALAQTLGWDRLVPMLAAGLIHADARKCGDELRRACCLAVHRSAVETTRLAAELSRRTAHLRSVVPKLRAKGAGAAVDLFLTRDAVAPTALPLPDRAARRLCDRLVDLGAVRELTGRDTFRLYGV